ncbi:Uncharacterized conserved protein [Halovenus aranensis]|uniref:Uncharacterized conserved protein n=1 Tax=Halovenus aranensis TaxID=890420 RepID=A0A1G8S300_9EURY|nr:hypothetical protein [Halovenus aranensis]SDJ23145.1 Uncharacterized conserved protein [Halovenus aranensis]
MSRPQRPQLLGLLLVVLCTAGALSLAGIAPASATESPEDQLNVTVSTDDDSVWVNETVDITVTVESTGDKKYNIEDIALVDEDGETLGTENPFGTTVDSSGAETFRIEDVQIDEPGTTELRAVVTAEYRLKQTEVTADESVTIAATNPEPVIDLTAERAVSGAERTLSLAVGNPHNGSINRVSASVEAPANADIRVVDGADTAATIEPSETEDLEFLVRGGSTGTNEFLLSLQFETPDGEYWEVTRRVTAEFLEPTGSVEPVVDLTAERAVSGSERTLSLAVGNPNNDSLNRVEASLSAPSDSDLQLADASAAVTTIEPSETRDLDFAVRGGATGSYEFTLSLGFQTPDGAYREITRPVTAEFREPTGSAEIDLAEASVSATPNGVRVNGSLFTAGNLSVRDVQITAANASGIDPARPDPQAYISALDGDSTGSFELTASLADDRDDIPLSIQYRTGGVERTTTVEVPYTGPRSVPPVQLSSVSVSGSGSVSISGEVANTRGNPVTGVTVRIPDVEGIAPGSSGEFFAGLIESGQFTPMEPITAEVTGPRETIPVEVSYTFQGTQYSSILEIDYDGGQSAGGGQSTDGGQQGDTAGGQTGGSLPEFDAGADGGGDGGGGSALGGLPMLVGGVAVVSLLIAAVVYRRR